MRYASIRNLDISNGESVGISLFVQGCDRVPHCRNCFNPETWDFNGGKEWTEETKNKFLELINRPYIKRVSILGGEPLADQNLDGVLSLIQEFRLLFPEKNIWLYTGYTVSEVVKQEQYEKVSGISDIWSKRWEIIKNVDVLVDGQYIDEQRNLYKKWAGSDNQRVINVKQSLAQNKIVLYCN